MAPRPRPARPRKPPRPRKDPVIFARSSATEWRQLVDHFEDGLHLLRRALTEDDRELACYLYDTLRFAASEISLLGLMLREFQKFLGNDHAAFAHLPDLGATMEDLFSQWKQLSETLKEREPYLP